MFRTNSSGLLETRLSFPLEVCVCKSTPLLNLLKEFGNEEWLNKIDSGEVRVFGRFVTSKYILKYKDMLTIDACHAFKEPKVNLNFSILFEDDYFLVVDKPAPLPVHPCGTHRRNSLTYMLTSNGFAAYSVNRIDSETSGLVFFAKKPQHGKRLAEALSCANKMYLVVVHGKFPSKLAVSMRIGRKPHSLVSKRMQAVVDGKDSFTRFKRLRFYFASNVSLLAAFPKTGRTHQIRAHLRETQCVEGNLGGYAVAGDKIYGRDEQWFLQYLHSGNSPALQKETDGLARQFLHAARCSFIHPYTKQRTIVRAPLAEDLRAYLSDLS